jgi:hypothetical protein
MNERNLPAPVDFRAQAAHMGFHDVRFRIEMEIPNTLQQHRSGDDTSFASYQEFQELKLAWQKFDQLSASTNSPSDQIHFQVINPQNCSFVREGWTAGESRQPRQEFAEGEGLDEVVVAAGIEAFDAIVEAREIRQEQHRRRNTGGTHGLDHAQTVEVGKHPVENHGIVTSGKRAIESVNSGCLPVHAMTERPQTVQYEFGIVSVILDDKNFHGASLGNNV